MRAEWRAEQEAATRDAAEDWQHRRTLTDRLREFMHRGDGLQVTVVGRRLTGFVEEVGDDLLALQTTSGRVDVHLAPTITVEIVVTAPAREGGHRGSDVAGGSFRQALIGREPAPSVLVGTVQDPDGRKGTLLVGADHVELATGDGRLVVPLPAVAWICRAPD